MTTTAPAAGRDRLRLLLPPLLAFALVGATCRGSEDKTPAGPLGAGTPAAAAPATRPPDDGLTESEFTARLPGIDPTGLSPKQRLDLAQLTEDTFCPCAPMTVAGCLRGPTTCRAAVRLTDLSRKLILAGQPAATTLLRVEAYFGSFPKERRREVGTNGPRKGPENAKVTVVEFSDLECPVCKAAHPVVGQVLAKYPNDVSVVFRHYPLPMHKHAEVAAHAAVFAHQQGKFWPFVDAVFARQSELGEPMLKDVAKTLGMDPAAMWAATTDEKTKVAVLADKAEGDALQVAGTPTLYVNGRQLLLPATMEWLSWTIDDELEWLANGQSWGGK